MSRAAYIGWAVFAACAAVVVAVLWNPLSPLLLPMNAGLAAYYIVNAVERGERG